MVEGSEEFIESAAYEQGKEGPSLVEAVMEEETQDDNPNISLNAITGSVTSRTMRIKGRVSNQEVVILIDSGSTHNFVDPAVVRRAQLPIDPRHRLTVTVANGEKMISEGGLCNVKLKLQGHVFTMEAYVLVLGGCDMVFWGPMAKNSWENILEF